MTAVDIAKPAPLMAGKRGLIMGVANDRSIAYGIARVLAGQGAEIAYTYQGDAFGRRAVPLAQSLGGKIILPCDVTDLASVDAVFSELGAKWGSLDFVVHALAFSDRNELKGRYADTTRDNFINTMVISCFSFTEIAKRGGSPHEKWRLHDYADLWRVHARRSALQRHGRGQGSARGFGALSGHGFRSAEHPRQRLVARTDAHARRCRHLRCPRAVQLSKRCIPRSAGRPRSTRLAALRFTFSHDLSTAVTGEIHYVDSGYNIVAMPRPETINESGEGMAIESGNGQRAQPARGESRAAE